MRLLSHRKTVSRIHEERKSANSQGQLQIRLYQLRKLVRQKKKES